MPTMTETPCISVGRRERSRRHRPAGSHSLLAYLVESKRVDGVPRQRTVAYFGTIWSKMITAHYHRHDFWVTADAALAKLKLSTERRSALEAKLAAVVPRPSAASRAGSVCPARGYACSFLLVVLEGVVGPACLTLRADSRSRPLSGIYAMACIPSVRSPPTGSRSRPHTSHGRGEPMPGNELGLCNCSVVTITTCPQLPRQAGQPSNRFRRRRHASRRFNRCGISAKCSPCRSVVLPRFASAFPSRDFHAA